MKLITDKSPHLLIELIVYNNFLTPTLIVVLIAFIDKLILQQLRLFLLV